jgi:hypothetical protein
MMSIEERIPGSIGRSWGSNLTILIRRRCDLETSECGFGPERRPLLGRENPQCRRPPRTAPACPEPATVRKPKLDAEPPAGRCNPMGTAAFD